METSRCDEVGVKENNELNLVCGVSQPHPVLPSHSTPRLPHPVQILGWWRVYSTYHRVARVFNFYVSKQFIEFVMSCVQTSFNELVRDVEIEDLVTL